MLGLVAAAGPARGGSLDSPGCMAGGATAVVESVDEDLGLRLADGRTVRLPGIAVPQSAVEARRELAAWLVRAPVAVAPLRTEADRWGRAVALVFAAPPGDPDRPVSVTEALLEAGRVLARPDPALSACWGTELRLEREAERQKHGLWAAPAVLAPGDAAALQSHAGRFVLAGGRIAAVREGRARVYLRFAEGAATGTSATLTLPLARRLAKAGTDPLGWAGRRLRVRGMLDDRWGWQIEVSEPQQIELDPP